MTAASSLTVLTPTLAAGQACRFHAMVKPVGSVCNLDCAYCYYLSKGDLLGHGRTPRMAGAVLEAHIRQYIEAQSGDEVVFSWQGGEPTLLGLPFFRKVIELQNRYRKPFQRIENDLQTNGTLLDQQWAGFFKEHGFLIGLSCDGPRELHDRYRLTKGGKPSFDKVFAAARLLKKYGVPFNALCVVNRANACRPLDVYRFLTRELGTRRVQFIPGVEPKIFAQVAPQHWKPEGLPPVDSDAARPGSPDSVVTDWSVDPQEWGEFLCAIWDDWFRRDYGKIHVDIFESAVAQSMDLGAQRCVTAEFCGKALAVEHDGEVFACDHYVYPEYRLGNLLQRHLGELAYSPQQQRFGLAKRDTLPQYCRQCPHLKLCWGECPRNRFVRTPDGEAGLNYLCPGLKRFYAHIQRDMPLIIQRICGGGRS